MSLNHKERNNRPKKLLISHPKFVEAWMEVWRRGGALDDIAIKLGTSRGHIYSRAEFLRKKGVRLPSFKSNTYMDEEYVEGLNDIIESDTRYDDRP